MFPANSIQIYLKRTGCKAFSVPRPPPWNCLLLPQLNLCFNLHFKTHLCSLEFPSHGISFLPYLWKAILCLFALTHLPPLGQKLSREAGTLFYFWLEYICFTVLVSAVQQSELAMCIHVSPPFCISFPLMSPRSGEWHRLRCTVGSHQLPVLCIVAHLCRSQSANSSPAHTPPPLSVSLRLFSTSVSVFLLFK